MLAPFLPHSCSLASVSCVQLPLGHNLHRAPCLTAAQHCKDSLLLRRYLISYPTIAHPTDNASSASLPRQDLLSAIRFAAQRNTTRTIHTSRVEQPMHQLEQEEGLQEKGKRLLLCGGSCCCHSPSSLQHNHHRTSSSFVVSRLSPLLLLFPHLHPAHTANGVCPVQRLETGTRGRQGRLGLATFQLTLARKCLDDDDAKHRQ